MFNHSNHNISISTFLKLTLKDDLSLSSETKLEVVAVKDDVLALEENITENAETNARVGLDTTEASVAVAGGSKVDVVTRNDSIVATNLDIEVRKSGAAIKDVSTVGAGVLGSVDLAIVVRDDAVVEEDKGGASVSNGGEGAAASAGATNGVAVGSELPESLAVVNGGVGKVTGVLGGVDESKVVGTGSLVLEGNSEDGGVEAALDVVVKCLLLGGRDGVDGREGQSEETIIAGVQGELAADLSSDFNGLGGCGNATDGYGVLVDYTAGRAAVSIGDFPGSAGDLLAGAGVVGVVGTNT